MTVKSYRGDAPRQAKVVTIPKPVAYTTGPITIVINNKKIRVESWDAVAMAAAWNTSGYPETVNITATAGEQDTEQYGTADTSLILTSNTPGEDFFVDVYIGDDDSINITNEVQQLTFAPTPTDGTFTLNFGGQVTGAITYIDGDLGGTAAAILAALEALSNIAPGDVTVSAVNASTFNIAFAGTYVNINVPQLVAANIDLIAPVNGSVGYAVVQVGVLPIDEVQILSLPYTPTGGTFTLTYAGQTTSAIDWDASAADVEAALKALSNIGASDVVCSGGDLPGTPVTITFASALADKDVDLITGDATLLTGGSNNVVTPTTLAAGSPVTTNSSKRFLLNTAAETVVTVKMFKTDDLPTTPTTFTFSSFDSAATIKAAFVGKTVGYEIDPSTGLFRDYVLTTDDIDVSGSLHVTGLTITFKGAYTLRAYPLRSFGDGFTFVHGEMQIIPASSSITTVNFTAGTGGSIEYQQFSITDPDLPGQYTLTVYDPAAGSHVTVPIDYSEVDASAIRDIINAALGAEYVYVTYSGGVFSVIYANYTAPGVNITQMTSNEQGISIVQSVQGSAGTPEIQRVTLGVSASTPISGGTFTLTYEGQTTTDLAYNASAATILAALEALSSIAPGDVAVSGSLGTALTFTFNVLLGDVSPIEMDITDLLTSVVVTASTSQTGGLEIFFLETTRNQGPECFDDPLNYDPVGVPSDGDDIDFGYGRNNCKWGTKQRDTFTVLSTTTEQLQLGTKRPLFQDDQKVFFTTTGVAPTGLTNATAYFIVNMDERGRFQLSTTLGGTPINISTSGSGVHTLGLRLGIVRKPARYGFQIGLPVKNESDFIEYRPRYLEVYADQIVLGEGQGNDSPIVRIDSGTRPITSGIQVYGAGSSSEPDMPSVGLLVQNNTVDIKSYGGEVGLAPNHTETSTVRDIELYDTEFSSRGTTTCRNVTGDRATTLQGKFVASGNISLGL